jgi:hypothetical protein
MTGIITIVAGTDTGPLIYIQMQTYTSAFASVSKLELTNGYPSNDLPIYTVKIKSTDYKFCRSYYTC